MNCYPYCGPRDKNNILCINCETYNSIAEKKYKDEVVKETEKGRKSEMDLQMILSQIEANFFSRLNKKTSWRKVEVKREFNEAIKEVLILTYSRVMKDVKEAKDGP